MCTHDDEPVSGELLRLGPVDELGDRTKSSAFAVTRSSLGAKTKKVTSQRLEGLCARVVHVQCTG